jgi:MFS family permease
MIETYAFLAAFTVQILLVSVLNPAWLAKYARAKMEAQLPLGDRKSPERFLTLYRAVNMGVAVLGLVLLGWVFSHVRSPDWNLRPAKLLLPGYALVQISPIVLLSLVGVRARKKALTLWPPEVKRTASLQRRGLFDIVSPLTVFLAVLAYGLAVASAIHLLQHPIPWLRGGRFLGYRLLGAVTLAYAFNAFTVYRLLYRRKRWPLETPKDRARNLESSVKVVFYVSITVSVFTVLISTLGQQYMQRWIPFSVSSFIVIVMLFTSMKLLALRRQAEADRLGSSPAS